MGWEIKDNLAWDVIMGKRTGRVKEQNTGKNIEESEC